MASSKTKAKHDWQAIRAEYVEAQSESVRPTLEALATRYACSPSYLREKAAKENWKLAAEQYLTSITVVRQTVKAEKVGTEQASWDDQCFKLTKAALGQVYTHLKRSTENKTVLELKELEMLTKALERLHTLGKVMQPDDLAEEIATADPSQYASMSAAELAELYQNRLKRPSKGSA